ncbi:MAG: aminoglycoside 3-N-acetyltransferase [Chloroflexi bacterium]|uniref:aminoglycoside 3-N-acetyltransferase n=1 Tax=Candidatus Flexifilum breve TaxID=3140694 RepID=UPI0031372AFE|nr:aminoglycoside 3-N-acetyltransferase [Chloroflexota bacterium]
MQDETAKPVVVRSQLGADLRRLGLRAGDTVLLHVSVKSIGWMVGGPQVVLKAIFDVLTAEGTLMMLASWEGNPYELDEWSDEEQQRWLDECPPFDPETSPADHRELSILAEYLRTWEGAQRSTHPLASFVAVGHKATWLTEVHPRHYGFGVDSPLGRLCAADGRVLVLGAPLSNLTLVHHAEQLVELPSKQLDQYQMPILQAGKTVWVDVEEFDTTDGIADFGVEDYFLEIGRAFAATANARKGTVGEAQAYLFPADGLKSFAIEWMQQHYRGPLPDED